MSNRTVQHKCFSVKPRVHVPFFQREKATYVYLRRRFYYSINTLAKAFGRSKSLIWNVIDFNVKLGTIHRADNRTFNPQQRTLRKATQWITLQRFIQAWEDFIFGEAEKPP